MPLAAKLSLKFGKDLPLVTPEAVNTARQCVQYIR
jgi:hypothetical protein